MSCGPQDHFCHEPGDARQCAAGLGLVKIGTIMVDWQPTASIPLLYDVAPGHHVIVACSSDSTDTAVTVSDPSGALYAENASAVDPVCHISVRVFSAFEGAGMMAGGQIVLGFAPAQGYFGCAAYDVTGLAPIDFVDRTATLVEVQTDTPTVTTPVTTQAKELVFGAFGEYDDTEIFTPGAGFAPLDTVVAGDSRVLHTEWKAVSMAAPQQVDGTLSVGMKTFVAAVTFKAAHSVH
jgi:hypothetical protein